MEKQLGPRWTCFSISLQMATSEKKSRLSNSCEMCDLSTIHLNKHTLRTHVPWYVSPSTACVDCHKSECFGKDRDRFHKGHRLISGENLLRAWFLLMNGLFLFMSRELGPEFLHWPPDLGSSTFLRHPRSRKRNISINIFINMIRIYTCSFKGMTRKYLSHRFKNSKQRKKHFNEPMQATVYIVRHRTCYFM